MLVCAKGGKKSRVAQDRKAVELYPLDSGMSLLAGLIAGTRSDKEARKSFRASCKIVPRPNTRQRPGTRLTEINEKIGSAGRVPIFDRENFAWRPFAKCKELFP